MDVGRDVVRLDRARWRDVVVVAAVLVVQPDQQRVRPARAVHDAVDDLGGEGFALGDVLRVLLRVGLEVRVDDADRGQRARVGVGEELRGLAQVPDAAAQPERVQVGGERLVADGPVGHAGQPPAGLRQPPYGGQPAAAEYPAHQHGVVPHVVVVDPADAVPGQHVEDRSGLRVVDDVPGQVVHKPVGRTRDEEPAVRERRAQAGAEPVIGQRERPREPVVEGQVLFGPVAHRHGRVAAGQRFGHGGGEAVVAPVRVLDMAGPPVLAGVVLDLGGGGRVAGGIPTSVRYVVDDVRPAIGPQRQALAPASQHAQVVVVRVVLHHQHDDVPDLRQQIGALGQVGPRPFADVGPPDPAPPDLPALKPFPHSAAS